MSLGEAGKQLIYAVGNRRYELEQRLTVIGSDPRVGQGRAQGFGMTIHSQVPAGINSQGFSLNPTAHILECGASFGSFEHCDRFGK